MNYKILSPKEGYDLIAPHYDQWYWQLFWRENELPLIEQWRIDYLSPGRGADLGSGSGNNLYGFLKSGHSIDAYDISSNMLAVSKKKYNKYVNKRQLRCIEADILDIDTTALSYDWVLSNRVLSHISDVELFAKKVSGLLRLGGHFFLSDVHPLRTYTHTHIIVENTDVYIETYKHPLSQIVDCFERYGFEVLEKKEMETTEVINGERVRQDGRPIFYYMIMKLVFHHESPYTTNPYA